MYNSGALAHHKVDMQYKVHDPGSSAPPPSSETSVSLWGRPSTPAGSATRKDHMRPSGLGSVASLPSIRKGNITEGAFTSSEEVVEELSKTKRDEWKAQAKRAQQEEQNNTNRCFDLVTKPTTSPKELGRFPRYSRSCQASALASVLLDLTIGFPDDHSAFDDYDGGADVSEESRRDRFLASALPENPTKRDPRLSYSDDGTPLLPPLDKIWVRNDIRSTLEAYYQAMRARGQGVRCTNCGKAFRFLVPEEGGAEPASVPHDTPASRLLVEETEARQLRSRLPRPLLMQSHCQGRSHILRRHARETSFTIPGFGPS
ncbi:hypothetical protein OH77DRAFT_1440606 [Trametes cingulata]|nr:hypothetical protein OH77DRAFT_1440606 [Trametes cingulata]